MKTITFKSTRSGSFTINLPDNFEKIQLPYFDEWTQTLKSGKFSQGTSALCYLNNKKLHYCCLGVLSKIQGRLKKDKYSYVDEAAGCKYYLDSRNPVAKILDNSGKLPNGVFITKIKNDASRTLAHCNDTLRLSFKDIAKIIETVYKK